MSTIDLKTKNIIIEKYMEIERKNKSQGWKSILKIVIPYFVVVAVFEVIGMFIAGVDFRHMGEAHRSSGQFFIISFMSLLGTVGIVWLFRTKVDKKSFVSIGFAKGQIGKDILIGLLLGFIMMLLGFICLILTKQLEFVNIQFNALNLIYCFGLFVFVAITEEVFARGYILNNLMVSFNKYVALVISALIFSLMHLANPGVSFMSLLIIFLSGLLLGLPYVYCKKLWFPIALHFSWNFFQGPIFGFNVSGMEIQTLITTKYTTANIWNGGKFGFEGSVLAAIFLGLAVVLGYFVFRNRIPVESDEFIQSEMESDQLLLDKLLVSKEEAGQ